MSRLDARHHTPCRHLCHDFAGVPFCMKGYYGSGWRRWITKRPICCKPLHADRCLLYMPTDTKETRHVTRPATSGIRIRRCDYKAHSEPLTPPVTDRHGRALDPKG